MTDYENLVLIEEISRMRDAQDVAANMARLVPGEGLRIYKHHEWISLPMEDARFASPRLRQSIVSSLAATGSTGNFTAVSLYADGKLDPVKVPPTDAALEEVHRRFGVFPFILISDYPRWSMVDTGDDVVLFSGSPSIVSKVVGDSVANVQLDFDRYVLAAGTPVERNYLRTVQRELVKYTRMNEGDYAQIPSWWASS